MRRKTTPKGPVALGRAVLGLLLSVACAAAGCSSGDSDVPPLGDVSGTVTLDGQPVAGAQVLFEPQSGVPSVGKTDDQGHYMLAYNQDHNGAVLGPHTVRITKYGEPGSPNDTVNQLPAKYDQNSPLTVEVKPGENSFDFPLESQP